MIAEVHGPRQRFKRRWVWEPRQLSRPRFYGYIDTWLGGSLVDFGFEVGGAGFDPAFDVGVAFEAAPGSLLDRLLVLLRGERRPKGCSYDGCAIDGPHYHRDTPDGEEVVRT